MAKLGISHNFYVKTSDLVRPIQGDHENKDFYINLLIQRLDEAIQSSSSPLRTVMCRLMPTKVPGASLMEADQETSKEKIRVKGILIVASIVERFDTFLICREELWNLVKKMYELAKAFYELKDYPILHEMHVHAHPLLSTLVDASFQCFHEQVVVNPIKYKKSIGKHCKLVEEAYNDLGTQMLLYILRFQQQLLADSSRKSVEEGNVKEIRKERKAIEEGNVKEIRKERKAIDEIKEEERNRERKAIDEIKEEERIREKKVKRIIKNLKLDEREGDKVAVIIQGDSGESKTDLAAAVYGRLEVELHFEGWKLCKKIFNKDNEFNPNVSELHSEIVNLFSVGKHKGKKGRRRQITKNEPAFIWIDNIVQAQDLRKILDMDFRSRNGVRLILTTPNKGMKPLLEEKGFICAEEIEMEHAQDTENISEKSSAPLLHEMAMQYLKTCKQENGETIKKKISKWEDEKNLVKTGFNFAIENAFLNLSAPAQEAFLDICAFFVGWDWDEIPFLVGKAESETLEENAWVKKSHNNQIAVPGVLCGWGISRTKGVRLTNRVDLKEALDKNQESIKGIFLPNDKEELQLPVKKPNRMQTLRVLSSGSSITLVKEGNKPISILETCESFERLRFLHVGRFSTIQNVGTSSQLQAFRRLSYFSSEQDVPFDPCKLPPKLKVVKLRGDTLFRYHDRKGPNLWKIDSLKVLKLQNFQKLSVPDPNIFKSLEGLKELCISTCSLVELPESLAQLYALQNLDLHDCKYLRNLPKSFGTLLRLVKLNLGYCSSLRHLPESFGQLQSLEELILSHCSVLKHLPESFVCLSKLRKATFSHCQKMKKLPDKFELLSSLEEVDLSYCNNLNLLAANFEMLSSLQLLNLKGCTELQKLPENFPQNLLKPKLVSITLSECSRLTELPDEFCQGNMIEDLSLAYCSNIPRLPSQINQLKCLRNLNLSGCKKLRELTDSFSQLTCLEVLNLSSCHKLRNLCNQFNRLKGLKDLNLSGCPALEGKWMKTLERNRSLRIVDIRGSPELEHQWGRCGINLCRLTVLTDKKTMAGNSIQRTLNSITRKLFRGKAILMNKNGKPFSSEEISKGDTLALIFDHNISCWDRQMLQNNVDELLKNLTGMKIIYVGKFFSTIPTKLADQVIAYTPDHSEALSLFDKPLTETAGPDFWDLRTYIVKTQVDEGAAGCKIFKEWDSISGMLVGKSFNIQDYHELEEMVALGTLQNNNNKLLKLLFREKEQEFMSKNNNTEKMVFLLISTLEISKAQISFLNEMYEDMQGTCAYHHGVDVEWIWVPVTIADEDKLKETYDNLKHGMRWVKTSEPYLTDLSTISVFFRERMGFCEMPILVCAAPSGLFSATDVMLKVATLGPEAWLFLNNIQFSLGVGTRDSDKLTEMQNSNLTHLYFLFKNFKEVSNEKMGGSQMVWLYGGDPEKVSNFKSKLNNVIKQIRTDYRITIVYVGRRSFLPGINNKEEQEESLHKQKLQNSNGIACFSLIIGNVKKFWHHVHYLLYLIASKKEEMNEEKNRNEKEEMNEEERKKLESFQRLLLALLSLDCLSRRNGTVWMMAVDGTHNDIFTGKGKDVVDLLDSNIQKSINSGIKLTSGAAEVRSSIAEGEPLIHLIQSGIQSGNEVEHKQTFDEGPSSSLEENKQTFEDAPWLRVHPSSHLVEQISPNMYCSMCCVPDPAYHCDMCGCFGICEKCYILEFIERSKGEKGEQIIIKVSQ